MSKRDIYEEDFGQEPYSVRVWAVLALIVIALGIVGRWDYQAERQAECEGQGQEFVYDEGKDVCVKESQP